MREILETVCLYCLFGSVLLPLTQGARKGGKFHESPRDVAVTVGEDVTLTCRIKHTRGSPAVQWKVQKDDGGVFVIGSKQWSGIGTISRRFPRCSWVTYLTPVRVGANDYRIYDLRIKQVQKHDSGNYTCMRTLTKYRSARLEVFPRGMYDVYVTQGNSVRLSCRIPNVKLAWWTISKKDGHHKLMPKQHSQHDKPTQYSDRVTYEWVLNRNTYDDNDDSSYDIIVKNAQKSDRGVYRCVTSPNQTKVEGRLHVLCDGDPVFDRRPHDTYAFLFKHVTLRCRVHARRGGKVIVRWKKATDSRNAWPKYYPFKHNDSDPFGHGEFEWANWKMSGNFDLTLFFNEKSDEGSYCCEAWPEHYDQFDEVVSAAATLRVIKKPKGSKGQYIPTLKTIQELRYVSQNARFSCIPKHKVIWLDEDLNVLTDNTETTSIEKRFHISSNFPEDFLISNIQVIDAQKYYCVLAGDKFVWEKTVQLVVKGCSKKTWHYDHDLKVCFGTAQPTIASTFGGAVGWCRQNNAHLVMPRNMKETGILQVHSKHIWGSPRKLWIGLDDIEWENVWKWADGRLQTGNKRYSSSVQPHNQGGYQNCALMDEQMKFRDKNCGDRNVFLCESPGIHWNRLDYMKTRRCKGWNDGWISFDCGELCYWISKEKMTWAHARDTCQRKDGNLAILINERLRRSGLLMMGFGGPQIQEAWIGLRKVGSSFEWIDGYFPHLAWLTWSPSHSDGDCVSVDANGRFNAGNCLDRKYFICEQPQDRLRNNGFAISVCGKTERTGAPVRKKRDAGPVQDSRINRTNDQLAIAAIFDADTITIADAPWAVRVIVKGEVVCSGVLIGPKTVLTSGHCVLHKRNRNMSSHDVMVGLGSEDRSARGGRLEPVHMIKVHGNYEVDQFDIAVIELKRKQLTDCWNVRQACLPESEDAIFSGFKCKVVSWGYEGALRFCDVDYNNLMLHGSTWTLFYTNQYHCKLGESDFGAPLICIHEKAPDPTWTVVGIYSEKFGRYFEFTYVPHYLKWIQDKMQGNDLPDNEFYYEVACYQQHVDISCDYGRPPLIQVVQAWYGTGSRHRCAYQTPKQVGCRDDVTQTLQQRCRATNRCQFDVTTELFGDPCPHAFEYLQLIYQCISVTGTHTDFHAVICNPGTMMELTCGRGNQLVISVRKAEFGHGPPGVCTSRHNPSCTHKTDVTKEIADRCDGNVDCLELITFKDWGDPCWGYKKHLEVGYTCVKKNSGASQRASVSFARHSSGDNLQPSAIMMMLAISSCLLLRALWSASNKTLNGNTPTDSASSM